MDFPNLESERLTYRKFSQDDFSAVFDWLNNAENMKFRFDGTKDESGVRGYLNWAIDTATADNRTNYEYAVCLKTNNELIGSATVLGLGTEPEIGWLVHRKYWRQGYGTEIGATLLKFCFEVLKLRRVIAGCHAENHGSYGIMVKIGMRREAHFVKSRPYGNSPNGPWHDVYKYAMLAEEWRNKWN